MYMFVMILKVVLQRNTPAPFMAVYWLKVAHQIIQTHVSAAALKAQLLGLV